MRSALDMRLRNNDMLIQLSEADFKFRQMSDDGELNKLSWARPGDRRRIFEPSLIVDGAELNEEVAEQLGATVTATKR